MLHNFLKAGAVFALVCTLSACNAPDTEDVQGNVGKIPSLEEEADQNNQAEKTENAVKLDFYVMSQCPYGTQVEDGIAPVMKKMGDAIDLNINYILYPASSYEGQEETYCIDGLCSMHGIPEVKGNIVQLCVNEIDPVNALDFISCQNKNMKKIPGNWESCAKDLELDMDKIKACYEGEEGLELMRENAKLADEVKAQGSPTIYMNDKTYQGGRSDLDFQRAICKEIDNAHAECKDLPKCATDMDCTEETDKIGKCVNPGTKEAKCEYSEATPLNITVLKDARCDKPECATENVIAQIKQSFKGIEEIQEIEYDSEEGKALYAAAELEMLPAYLFEADVKEAYFYEDLKMYLQERGEYYELATGSSFDPTKEICDNEKDDTDNGFIDCADEDCNGQLVCREEQKGRLDLFVMSQCPYGTRALDAMTPVLEAFEGELDFNVNFIANETEPGKFDALHGQPEVDENIRELCAIKHYAENYKYMDYITCRNPNITSDDWEPCVEEAGMDLDVMKTCAEGEEGIQLHSDNIKIANALQIGASPTWLANNKYQFSGIDAATVQKEICKHNPDLKGCSADLSGVEAADVPAGSCN